MRQFTDLAALADYICDEFSDAALNEVMMLSTRLESTQLKDMRQIKITCTNLEGVKLIMTKTESGIEYQVKPV